MLFTPLILLFPAIVQEPTTQVPAPTPAPQWSTSIQSFWMEPPNSAGYLSAILYADRGPLHLEARWAYEDRNTLSVFAGWAFPWQGAVHGSITPMIGIAGGDTDGIVPAASLEVGWKALQFTSDVEYLFATSDNTDDFFYSWSELTYALSERVTVGVVAQRTHVFDQDLSVDRGVLFGITLGQAQLTAYFFNLDQDDPYFSIAVGGGF